MALDGSGSGELSACPGKLLSETSCYHPVTHPQAPLHDCRVQSVLRKCAHTHTNTNSSLLRVCSPKNFSFLKLCKRSKKEVLSTWKRGVCNWYHSFSLAPLHNQLRGARVRRAAFYTSPCQSVRILSLSAMRAHASASAHKRGHTQFHEETHPLGGILHNMICI